MAQQLHSALTALQVLVLENAPQLSSATGDQVLQRVAEVATQLHKDLTVVIATTQVAVQQVDFANRESGLEILKESTTRAEQERKSTVSDEVVSFEKEVAFEQLATETTMESVESLPARSENVIVLEAESQLNDDSKETAAVSFEQVVAVDSTDNAAIVEMQQAVDESIPAKCATVSKVEAISLDSEALVPMEPVVPTDQKEEIKDAFVGDDKVNEEVVQKKEDILQECVNLEAPDNEAANIISVDEITGLAKSDKLIDVTATPTGNLIFHKLSLVYNQNANHMTSFLITFN